MDSVSVAGSAGRRFKSRRCHFSTCNNFEQVIHSHSQTNLACHPFVVDNFAPASASARGQSKKNRTTEVSRTRCKINISSANKPARSDRLINWQLDSNSTVGLMQLETLYFDEKQFGAMH